MGHHSGHNDALDLVPAEKVSQSCAVEGAVLVLSDNRLLWQRRDGVDDLMLRISRLHDASPPAPHGAVDVAGAVLVPREDHGELRRAERSKQIPHAWNGRPAVRKISVAFLVDEVTLHVDDEERRPGGKAGGIEGAPRKAGEVVHPGRGFAVASRHGSLFVCAADQPAPPAASAHLHGRADLLHGGLRHGARTLFATHYHELTELSLLLPQVANYNIAVREWADEIVFLHKIVEGPADKSYGIQVARLAGVPKEVVERSKTILRNLEAQALDSGNRPSFAPSKSKEPVPGVRQFELFAAAPHPVVDQIRKCNLDTLAPLEALLKLKQWKDEIEKREGK